MNPKTKMIAIVGASVGAVVIAALVVVIVILMKPKPTAAPTPVAQGRGTVVTEENVASEMAGDVNPDSSYTASMNVNWSFATGDAQSTDAYVENSTLNNRTVYFDVNLDDGSNKLVYTSPFIPVGSKVENIALTEKLPKGVYPAVCTYHLVDDENKDITTVSVSVTLHVLA